ncbi:GNAT family N-acetyltransferase [Chloroflexota bacterium]
MREANISDLHYNIRNYQPIDFDNYVGLVAQAEELEPKGRCLIPEVIIEHLYYPEQNLFIVEIDVGLVGYMNVWPELTIARIILDCWIHPDYRRKGIAKKLTDYAVSHGKKLGVKYAHVNVPESDVDAQYILSKLGFSNVRRYIEMSIETDKINWECTGNDGFECRCMKEGEESKLVEIQNRAFTGTWGYNPNTVEEISYRANMLYHSPEDVILICKGDTIAGYCWTRKNITGKVGASETKGQIFMLGVDENYRGGNIGRRVLLAGISKLVNEGLLIIELIVDSQNETAYKLYQSVGFEVKASSLWYEKTIS